MNLKVETKAQYQEKMRLFFNENDPRRDQATNAIQSLLGDQNLSGNDLPNLKISDIVIKANEALGENEQGLELNSTIRRLWRYPLTISINGQAFTAIPQFPTASESSARQLARGAIQRELAKNAELTFVPAGSEAKRRNVLSPLSIEQILALEPKGEELVQVFNWFKEKGGKKWLMGDQNLFAERLIQLARGEEVDFLIWNCVGFGWEQLQSGEYPITTILDNSDTAITYYFKDRIREMSEKISEIGPGRVVILLPTNEVFAEELNVWQYTQTTEEREKLFANIDANLQEKLGDLLSDNIQIMRWDDYLQQAEADQEIGYTRAGIAKMQNRSYSPSERQELAVDICNYFTQFGITLAPTEEVADGQIRYYGMYAGEGIASKGNQIGDRKMVWVNFEEGTVPTSQLQGADGELAIVTPASPNDITKYYQWKRRRIQRGLK